MTRPVWPTAERVLKRKREKADRTRKEGKEIFTRASIESKSSKYRVNRVRRWIISIELCGGLD
jgi:hypothetical protein